MKALDEYIPHSDFVPSGLDAAKWGALEPLYADLLKRDVKSVAALERLILDRSDLDAAAAEAASVLYINMTCHTDDEGHNRAYLEHIQQVQPQLKESGFELDKKIAESVHVSGLDQMRYHVYLRNIRAGIEVFRAINVPIETAIAELDQEYSQICGALTVQFRGAERTLPQMSVFQEEPDRATREAGWRAVAERRYQERERIGAIYDEMVRRREEIAKNAGFPNFRDYSFKAKRRFDYTPGDCDRFAEGVEKTCVPALRRLHDRRRSALGVESLKPWDLHVDVQGRAALRPFETSEELVERTSRVFHRMEPSLGKMFDSLRRGGCLDLETRKGKAPGGYQANRDWTRQPFIFMNAAGIQRDVETLLHEAGHAFHAILSRNDPLVSYRADIPHEFAEVASMSMELTAHPFMEEFYPASGSGESADALRARRVHLESLTTLFPIVTVVDQFQHWIYTNPGHTRAEREAVWVSLSQRFGGSVDWSGMEHLLSVSWHRILHLFGVPFYYIEYGIAQLGALQLWMNYRRNAKNAIAKYMEALEFGGGRPLADLYAAAGLKFDMGSGMIERLWADVEGELARLPG